MDRRRLGVLSAEPRLAGLQFLDDDRLYALDSNFSWEPIVGIPDSGAEIQNAALFGLGTTADAANPFSARINKALWTALYAGDGG